MLHNHHYFNKIGTLYPNSTQYNYVENRYLWCALRVRSFHSVLSRDNRYIDMDDVTWAVHPQPLQLAM